MKPLASRLRPTRRAVLGSLATLLAIGAWPGARAAHGAGPQPKLKPVRFVAMNDTHHDGDECDPWMEALFRQIAATEGATRCFGLGDLANSGELESLRAIQRIATANLGMPFHPSPGNHDLDLSPVDGFYASVFPETRNYRVEENGWHFLVIDTTEGAKWNDVTIHPSTLDWLDATLPTIDPAAPIVLLTHFPLAAEVPMCPTNAEAVLAKFIGHNLRGSYGGHFHGVTRHPRGAIALKTCACVARVRGNHHLAPPEKGYYVVDGDARGRLTTKFVEFNPPF